MNDQYLIIWRFQGIGSASCNLQILQDFSFFENISAQRLEC